MRLRSPAPRHRGLDDGTVPLINVGFLLLLHLLVAGELGGVDELPMVLPKADHAERDNQQLAVQIDVTPGEPVLVRINQQTVPLHELPAYLPEPDGAQPPMVRADASLTTAQLSAVLAAIREAGYAKLRLAARPTE